MHGWKHTLFISNKNKTQFQTIQIIVEKKN